MARKELLDILVCQQCHGKLALNIDDYSFEDILEGALTCDYCCINYPISRGIVFFGVPSTIAKRVLKEMDHEFNWNFKKTSLSEHLSYLSNSVSGVASIINHVKKTYLSQGSPLALDIGSGSGAISRLLVRQGFRVIATELSPEALKAGEGYIRNAYFERVTCDCSLLPYTSSCFDMVLCKELAHHIEDIRELFGELIRVLKPGGILLMVEPFQPRFRIMSNTREYDKAREEGLSHQDYKLVDYLSALEDRGVAICELSVLVFRGEKHPRLVSLYNVGKRLVGADNPAGGLWFKTLVSQFFGGTLTLIGIKQVNRQRGSAMDNIPRQVEIISVERLSMFAKETQYISDHIAPFIEVIDRACDIYSSHKRSVNICQES